MIEKKKKKMKIQNCNSIQLWCLICSRGWKGYSWWARKLVQRLYNVISIRNNITPIKVTYMYQKVISVNSCPFSTSDMGIANSCRRIHPKLMDETHVFNSKDSTSGRRGMIEWCNLHKTHLPLFYLSYPHPKIYSLVNTRPQGLVNTSDLV